MNDLDALANEKRSQRERSPRITAQLPYITVTLTPDDVQRVLTALALRAYHLGADDGLGESYAATAREISLQSGFGLGGKKIPG